MVDPTGGMYNVHGQVALLNSWWDQSVKSEKRVQIAYVFWAATGYRYIQGRRGGLKSGRFRVRVGSGCQARAGGVTVSQRTCVLSMVSDKWQWHVGLSVQGTVQTYDTVHTRMQTKTAL